MCNSPSGVTLNAKRCFRHTASQAKSLPHRTLPKLRRRLSKGLALTPTPENPRNGWQVDVTVWILSGSPQRISRAAPGSAVLVPGAFSQLWPESSPPGHAGSSNHLRVKALSGVETQTTGCSCPAGPGVFLHGPCPDLGAGARVPSEMEEGTLMAGQRIRAPHGGSRVTWT